MTSVCNTAPLSLRNSKTGSSDRLVGEQDDRTVVNQKSGLLTWTGCSFDTASCGSVLASLCEGSQGRFPLLRDLAWGEWPYGSGKSSRSSHYGSHGADLPWSGLAWPSRPAHTTAGGTPVWGAARVVSRQRSFCGV